MKLNEIDSATWYPVMIPSTLQKTKFRPFRVKDEKALLVAQESNDAKVMMATLEDIIHNCVKDCPKDLTTFDVEYLFVLLRTKSVGELSDAVSTCVQCGHKNKIQIDLSKVDVDNVDVKKELKLSDELVVLMKFPTINQVATLIDHPDQELAAIMASIETVYFGDEVIHTNEATREEITGFIENRTNKEMEQLTHFIENIPTVILKSEYECEKCGHTNKIQIKNLSDFF